jgi:glycosyltransferase involved in cell wall biosynthesis
MNAGPRLCFIGPMVGRHSGYATSQGMILADLFEKDGYLVFSASDSPNRYVRPLHILSTLIRRRRRVDIQCLEVYGGPSFLVEDLSSGVGKSLGHRIVMTLHGGGMPEFMARHPEWTRRVLSRADAIVVPSPFLKRAIEQYGFTARVIPNVIDLSDYDFRLRQRVRPRLFWMRSFHPIFNPKMAVEVLELVKKSFPDASLVMAGSNKGLHGSIEEFARGRGLSGSIRFPGFLDQDAKRQAGNACDIFINTNHVDNMPVAIVEACAMGLPVVATNVGGIPDLVTDGKTGLLVPDGDVSAMAGAIGRLVNDPAIAASLSAQGRALAEASDWEHVRAQWQEVFEQVMSGSSKESESRHVWNLRHRPSRS